MRHLYLTLSVVFSFVTISAAFAQQPCEFWYVSPSGSGTVGTPGQPVSLDYALSNINPSRNYVRMLGGNYPIANKIVLPSGVTVEGGYQVSGNDWVLSTNAPTNINITPPLETASVGGVTVGHHIGIEAVNAQNFVLRNLTVQVKMNGATGQTGDRGHSIYGIYLNGSSGFEITMVKVFTGSGSKGVDGDNVTSLVGTPSNGGAGGSGAGGCSTGQAGSPGAVGGNAAVPYGTTVPAATGGSAGAGGPATAGPGCNFLGCDGSNRHGNPGGTGGAGGNGHSWAPNNPSPVPAPTNTFFVPADRQDGGDGAVGGGGGGGSGNTAGTCACVSCGARNGATGGVGGRGGNGGRGGFGGGGAFGIYAVNSTGVVEQCELTPGAGGPTSAGGSGQTGELGGVGGIAGCNGCVCANRCGGNGGQGGVGGTGGRGRDGAPGASIGLAQVQGASVQQNGTTVPTQFGPVTVNQYAGCTNSDITITQSGGSFNLGAMGGAQFVNNLSPASTSYTVTSATAGVFYTSTGQHDIVLGGTVYNDLININSTRPLPTLAIISNGIPTTTPCSGTPVSLQTQDPGTDFEWAIIANGTPSAPSGGAAGSSTTHVFPQQGTYLVRLRVKDECCGWSIPVFEEVNVGEGPTVSLGNDTSICFPGSIALDAGPNFNSYSWQPGGQSTQMITATTAGTYAVVVTDNTGCQGTAQVVISGNPPVNPFILPNGPTAFCPGGNVTLTANAGYASYIWSDGLSTGSQLTVSQSGTYFVVAQDALGCSGPSLPVTVTVHPAPVAQITPAGNIVICQEASIVLNAPNGLSYAWSTNSTNQSITVTETGVYTVTVTDANGCESTSAQTAVTVHVPVVPTITTNGPLEFCNGANALLSVEANYASYLWNSGSTTPQVSITQSGSYWITVMDPYGCIDSSLQSTPVHVTVWTPQPQVAVVADLLVITDATNYNSFQWYHNGQLIPGATESSYTINPTGSGNYWVQVTDANGCTGTSQIFELTCCTGIADNWTDGQLNMYPNPTGGDFTLELSLSSAERIMVEMFDVTGRSMWTDATVSAVAEARMPYDISSMSNGIYFVRVTAGEQSKALMLVKR